MARPTLTDDQRSAIQAAATAQTSKAANLVLAQAAQDAAIAAATKVDDAFKALFTWYNDAIIGKYDAEKKALNGVYVASPVLESDIVSVAANPSTGRLVPTYPSYDVLRIDEFDGGGTTTTTANETQAIADQAVVEGKLTAGFGGTSPTGVTTTSKSDAALTPASTTLKVKDTTNALTFAIGNRFVVKGVTDSAVVEVTSVTVDSAVAPYQYTLGITQLVSATLATGADIKTDFVGFTNAERTAKVATVTQYQNIMNALITELQAQVNLRISRLNEQLAAIAANEDPDGTAALATATTNANTSKTFLTNYLVTTVISDTGLGTLSTERGTRGGQITARVTAIGTAYTGQTENYYDARYSVANNRGNLQRGSLREVANATNAKGVLTGMGASLADSTAALNSLL